MKRFWAALLGLMLLAGCAFAADMSEVRGFQDNGGQEYQYVNLGTYPYSEKGAEAPLTWRILYRDGDQATLISEYIIDVYQMVLVDNYEQQKKHTYGWRKVKAFEDSDLYAYLNSEMQATILKNQDFSAAIVPHEGDLFYIMTYADMMNEDYGFPHTKAGNTAENEGERAVKESGRRKAWGTPYAQNKVLYPDWSNKNAKSLSVVTAYKNMNYGGSSPYWVNKMRPGYRMSGIVGANGHLSWSDMGDVQKGVRPSTVIDLSKLELTGGSGTLEKPWTMEVK